MAESSGPSVADEARLALLYTQIDELPVEQDFFGKVWYLSPAATLSLVDRD
jgi:hypothetical protein